MVLLLHGRTWSGRPDFDLELPEQGRSLMDELVVAGFAAVAMDQRGYGGTPRDPSGWLTPNRAVADIAAVLRWARARWAAASPPAVLGWSQGALLAQLCGQRHPELVSALVLYGYPHDSDRRYTEDPTPDAPPAQPNTAAAAKDFVAPNAIGQAAIDAFVAAALAADPTRADWRNVEEWNALDPAMVRAPVLLIHGELDPWTPLAHQAKLFTRLPNPNRRWVILPGADHFAHMEKTGRAFVAAVVDFLRRL